MTVVALVNRKNVKEGSAGDRVRSLDQSCGKPSEEDIKSNKVLKELILKNPFDTLLLLDKEAKHELLLIRYSGGESKSSNAEDKAVRDVLTFNTRRAKPKKSNICFAKHKDEFKKTSTIF